THTPAEAVIVCDAVHGRNDRSPESLNWSSGLVITKAQRAGFELDLKATLTTLGMEIGWRWSTTPLQVVLNLNVGDVKIERIRVNPSKNSQNVSGISKIVGENDEFRPNHMTASCVFVGKVDGDDLGFRPRVWDGDDGV
ncbi:hypothetical protein DVH24_029820, partial [Malus domestica]